MNRLLLLFFLVGSSGCATVEFVRKDITPQKQGILRHSPPSNPEREAEYKNLVNEKARDFCGGEFKVTKEYQALEESRSSVGVGTGFGLGGRTSMMIGGGGPRQTMYNFVEFVCQ